MISRFFIDRPVFAGVIAIIMVLAGAISSTQLAVEQYPEVAPPTVQVSAVYPGADAQTVAQTVGAPVEQQINGVEGMLYMSSISSDDGSYALTITFELGTDVDMAAVRVQNRLSIAEPRLPSAVRDQGVAVSKQSPSLLMVIAPHSPDGQFDQLYLSNYARIFMVDRLARVDGVGSVSIFGAKDYSMRVWLDPEKLASRDLTTTEVLSALRSQNVQVAAGKIGQEPIADDSGFQYTITTRGRLSTPEEFERVVLKVGDGQRTVVLGDVARIELGSQSYDSFGRFNGMEAPVLGVYQLPGSNAMAVSQGVRAALEELRADFPEGLESPVFYDFTEFVEASISEVVATLLIASLLVFVTVFVFLQDFRATLIAGVAIPVSIVGTLAVLLALGFGLNMLTLLGLVLAIGIVVDDAIVVVENTSRLMAEEGLGAREAARRSMEEITGPVIATTLVLLAVFVPTAVLPGITGQLYRQFGVTLSVATLLSSINALTLSPALCAVLLRPPKEKRFVLFRMINRVLDASTTAYSWTVARALRVSFITIIAFVGMILGVGLLLRATPTGFIPLEDQKYFFVNVSLPPASKVGRTDEVLKKVEAELLDTPGVAGVVTIGGVSLLSNAAESNTGTCIAILDTWDERTRPEQQIEPILGGLAGRFAAIPEALIFPFRPPSIQGLGRSGGFELQIQDRAGVGLDVLEDVTGDVVAGAAESGEIAQPYTSFSARTPQLFLDIDRTKAQRIGVPLDTIFGTLSANLGSAYVNDFNAFGRVYQVRVQSEPEFRTDPDDILLLKVRDAEGDTLPLDSVARIDEVVGPSTVYRYNLFSSASVTGDAATGLSTGQAMQRMGEIAAARLPSGFGFEWTGIAFQQRAAGNVAVLVFAMSIVFVYLFLAAQYESWILPFTIMATIPIGILGALAATLLRSMDNNVYTQIGLVLLVALVCKNAILIVEFAETLLRSGKSLRDATLEASRLRFRPILMTALSFVLGTLPLVIASGAGANGRQSIGTAVFGGMALATLIGVVFIPALYTVIRTIAPARTTDPEAPTPA
ncbi:MAG: multidrug efflux RND transporter permease subunit [Planctomycetota bacterium]